MLGLDGVQLSETFPLGREVLASSNAGLMNTGGTPLRPWHLYIFYTALILAAGTGLSYIVSRQSAPKTAGSASAPTASAPVKSAVKPKAAVAKPKPQAAPVQAKLNLKADSKLRRTANLPMSAPLNQDRPKPLRQNRKFVFPPEMQAA
jgi:hypothetical protein